MKILLHTIFSLSIIFFSITQENWKGYQLINVVNENNIIKLNSRQNKYSLHKGDDYTELYISFDSPFYVLDDNKRYKISTSSFTFINNEKRKKGRGCALFYLPSHKIVIQAQQMGFIGKIREQQSFTIEMWINPLRYNTNAVIFRRICPINGKLYGIEILQHSRYIESVFHNFFIYNKKTFSIKLTQVSELKLNKWAHIAISYSKKHHSLSLYINGRKEKTVFTTVDNSPYGESLKLFYNPICMAPAIIGKSYIGMIDELRITNRDFDTLLANDDIFYTDYPDIKRKLAKRMRSDKSLYQRPIIPKFSGKLISPVYDTKYNNTLYRYFKVKDEILEGTLIQYYYRSSNVYFSSQHKLPFWHKLTNGSTDIAMGRYFQWMAIMYPSDDGRRSPIIKSLTLKYDIDEPPVPPYGLIVKVNNDNNSVNLQWKPNLEGDIGGYNIYYGYSKNQILGRITHIKGKSINKSNFYDNNSQTITVVINNEVIKENRYYNKGKNSIYVNPEFFPGQQYVFFITAYDKLTEYKKLHCKNINFTPNESKPSKYIVIRFGI